MSLWSEPKYPGDIVRQQCLIRAKEFGLIVIQHYNKSVRVSSFLPGQTNIIQGDTPKFEPEISEWVSSSYRADEVFDEYVRRAYVNGWQVDYVAERIHSER